METRCVKCRVRKLCAGAVETLPVDAVGAGNLNLSMGGEREKLKGYIT